MCSGVDIGTVLHFDGFGDTFDKPPELAFDIIFSDRLRGIRDRIECRLVSEVTLLEVMRSLLELLKGVYAPLLEAEFAGPNETLRAMPVIFGDAFDLRIKTITVVSSVAAVAEQDVGRVVLCTTCFAALVTRESAQHTPRFSVPDGNNAYISRTLVGGAHAGIARMSTRRRLARLGHVRAGHGGSCICKCLY